MLNPKILGRSVLIAVLPGDGELPAVRLRGTLIGESESKVPRGTAFYLKADNSTREILRLHTADPGTVLVDLEDLPASRLPGMPNYIGGAFVRLYGKATLGNELTPSSFSKYLGTGEVLEREDQRVLETPPRTYSLEARRVIRLTRKDFGIRLDAKVTSIPDASRLMAAVGVAGLSPDGLGRLIFLWGTFLGECVKNDFRGMWFDDPKFGELVLVPRGKLPPVRVKPFRVAEQILRRNDPTLASDWLARVKKAVKSTDFLTPIIE